MGIFYDDELYHHGILGMKWGIRRYQNYPSGYSGKGKYVGKESSGENKTRSRLKTAAKIAAGAALAGGAGYLAYRNKDAIRAAAKKAWDATSDARSVASNRLTSAKNAVEKTISKVPGETKNLVNKITGNDGRKFVEKAKGYNPVEGGINIKMDKLSNPVTKTVSKNENVVWRNAIRSGGKDNSTIAKMFRYGKKRPLSSSEKLVNAIKSGVKTAADTGKKVASNRRVQTAAVGSLAAGAAGVPVIYAANKAQKAIDRKMAPYTAAMLSAKNPNAEVSYTQYRKKKRNQ